jgi:hypothetical protein
VLACTAIYSQAPGPTVKKKATATIPVATQCYQSTLEKGKQLFIAGHYSAAKSAFLSAISCNDAASFNDGADAKNWLNKCNNVLKNAFGEKTYGGSNDDEAKCVGQTTDGGYIVAGYSKIGILEQAMFIIKLDKNGKQLWEKKIGNYRDCANSLVATYDGGCVVAGDKDRNPYIIKLDEKGEQIWQKSFGGSNGGHANSIIETIDGEYVIAGSTFDKGMGACDFWVIKLNKEGNLIWNQTFGTTEIEVANSIIETTDKGYAIAGYTEANGNPDFWIIKIDNEGNKIMDKIFDSGKVDIAYSIIETYDRGLVVAGDAGGYSYWIIKLDREGEILWEKFSNGVHEECAKDIIETSDHRLMIAGYTYNNKSSTGSSDFWVVKLSQSGSQLWSKTFGGPHMQHANSIFENSDGNFLVVGDKELKGSWTKDFWIIKLDNEGKLN